MIDWPTIKQTIKDQMTLLSGLDARAVRWRDESEGGVWTNVPAIYLRISSINIQGWAEERLQYEGPIDPQRVNVANQKKFTLSVRAESFTQDITDPTHAGALLDVIITRLWRSTSVDARAGIFAIQEYLGTKRIDYVDEGRQISAYNMDLLCATVDNDVDTDDASGFFIDEAQVQGTIKDGTGATLATVDLDVDTDPSADASNDV